jgi:hypothetical protein
MDGTMKESKPASRPGGAYLQAAPAVFAISALFQLDCFEMAALEVGDIA